jgi:hypothetical protein
MRLSNANDSYLFLAPDVVYLPLAEGCEMAYETTSERMDDETARISVSRLATPDQFVLGVCRCWDAFMRDPDPGVKAARDIPRIMGSPLVRRL